MRDFTKRRNTKEEKCRDLRKATLKCEGFTAYDLHDKLHPEPPSRIGYDSEWLEWHRDRDHWVQSNYRVCYRDAHSMGTIPSYHRRCLNRHRRAVEKAALRRAFLRDEWDDFYLPQVHRHDLMWLYW